ITPPPMPTVPVGVPIYAGSQAGVASGFYAAREALSPPLTGRGGTICILDSGIRRTHVGLAGKVLYEANFSSAPTVEDVYDHGTGVAFMAAGGRHAPGEESGTAPGASLFNIKVLGDDGEGTLESVVLGLEHVMELRERAVAEGLPNEDPLFPNIVNMSWGAQDDGDPDSPIRVACRAALEMGFGLVAAAGNAGPSPGTVTTPATDPAVLAVGALTFSPFQVWDHSSRGPTREGLVKPDLVFYGVNILTASAKSDTAFELKAGTSFSTPAVAGLAAMAYEAALRVLRKRISQEEAMQLVQSFMVKPQGAPPEKDNEYGYGLPFAQLMAQGLQGGLVGVAGLSDALGMVAPIFTIGMLGVVMRGLVPAR
ncbi:MAG: S8 family serine peptidase, partial [Chloroflexota bacterium]|nr:S8 family serine peptidase [Chloroflexota bacterium]